MKPRRRPPHTPKFPKDATEAERAFCRGYHDGKGGEDEPSPREAVEWLEWYGLAPTLVTPYLEGHADGRAGDSFRFDRIWEERHTAPVDVRLPVDIGQATFPETTLEPQKRQNGEEGLPLFGLDDPRQGKLF